MGERIDYAAGDVAARGYLARPEAPNGAAVLVAPAFSGLREFEMAQCDRMAARGYVALGVDYYGDGWVAEDRDAASAAMRALNDDRARLLDRTAAALDEVRRHADGPVGAFGFCFGGKAVLDMARAGHLDAAASLHGIYDRPAFPTQDMPPVLLCHGWDDPLADPDAFVAIAAELTAHCPDWHALALGGTGHAFTNPAQGDPVPGMGYVERSAERAWAALEAFLDRTLLP